MQRRINAGIMSLTLARHLSGVFTKQFIANYRWQKRELIDAILSLMDGVYNTFQMIYAHSQAKGIC